MRILFLLILICTFNAKARANGFVGAGGDGVEIGGKIIVHDLFSLGIKEHPYFGNQIDPLLPELPPQSAMNFTFPRLLLRQKLTDLNRIAPGLGDFVLMSMRSYTWVLADFELKPILDPDDVVILPTGARLVQIANRLGLTIRIHRQRWIRLDDANKVALLIHEAIYSLVQPVPAPGGFAVQNARAAREITGAFFEESFFSRNPAKVFGALAAELAIPDEVVSPSQLRRPPQWSFNYWKMGNCGMGAEEPSCDDNDPPHKETYIDFSKAHTYAALEAQLSKFCRRIDALKRRTASVLYDIQSDFRPRVTRAEVSRYRASSDKTQFQSYIKITKQTSMPGPQGYQFENIDGCLKAFNEHLNRAADELQ